MDAVQSKDLTIEILKPFVGDWKVLMAKTTRTHGGQPLQECVGLDPGYEDVITDWYYNKIPPRFLFSDFVDRIYDGKIDTDSFKVWAKFVASHLSEEDLAELKKTKTKVDFSGFEKGGAKVKDKSKNSDASANAVSVLKKMVFDSRWKPEEKGDAVVALIKMGCIDQIRLKADKMRYLRDTLDGKHGDVPEALVPFLEVGMAMPKPGKKSNKGGIEMSPPRPNKGTALDLGESSPEGKRKKKSKRSTIPGKRKAAADTEESEPLNKRHRRSCRDKAAKEAEKDKTEDVDEDEEQEEEPEDSDADETKDKDDDSDEDPAEDPASSNPGNNASGGNNSNEKDKDAANDKDKKSDDPKDGETPDGEKSVNEEEQATEGELDDEVELKKMVLEMDLALQNSRFEDLDCLDGMSEDCFGGKVFFPVRRSITESSNSDDSSSDDSDSELSNSTACVKFWHGGCGMYGGKVLVNNRASIHGVANTMLEI